MTKEQKRESAKRWREAHPEKVAENRVKQRERWAAMSLDEKAAYYARRKAAGKNRISKRRYYEKNKAAINEKTKGWRLKNLDRVKAFRREKNLAQYGLTTEARDAMLAAQGGGCAICRRMTPGGQGQWHVDHDHAIGPFAVRGILCGDCNTTLGKIGDTLEGVRTWTANAVEYMERAVMRVANEAKRAA